MAFDAPLTHAPPTIGRYPGPVRAWYMVSLLTVASVLSFVDKYLPALLIEPIKQDLGLSDTQMGLLLGPAFAAFYALMGLPMGWMADRYRRTTLVGAGVALWSLATAVSGLARSFGQLLLARVAVGLGDSALAPGALSLIGDSFPAEQRGRPVALYITAQSVGAGLAALGGGAVLAWAMAQGELRLPLLGVVAPWQFTFLAVGLPGLLVAGLLAVLKEPARQASEPASSIGHTLRYLGARWRAFAGFTGLVCVMTIIAYSQNWYMALFARTWGWSIPKFALWSGLALVVVGPLVVNGTGWLADRWRSRGAAGSALRIVMAGTWLLVPTAIVAPLMPSAELAFAMWLLNMVGLSTVSAAAPIALLDITPGQIRGQVSALFYMVIMLVGLVVGPLAVGLLADHWFGPAGLRYAAALVPALVGVPGLALATAVARAYGAELGRQHGW